MNVKLPADRSIAAVGRGRNLIGSDQRQIAAAQTGYAVDDRREWVRDNGDLRCGRVDPHRLAHDDRSEVKRASDRGDDDRETVRAAVVGAGEVRLAAADSGFGPGPTPASTVPTWELSGHVPAFACASEHSGTPADVPEQAGRQVDRQPAEFLVGVLARERRDERRVGARLKIRARPP